MRNDLRLSDRYRIRHDGMCWNLIETVRNTREQRKHATRERTTYHPTLRQVARAIGEREAGEAARMAESVEAFQERLGKRLEELVDA